jgi:hypothetical protein
MASNRRRSAICACVFGTATLAVGIGVATGAKLKTKSASTPITTDQEFGSAKAKCKRGSEAVSGGFEGSGFDQGVTSQLLPIDSARAGKRQWTSAGAFYYAAGATSGELTSYAYCDKSKPRLQTKSATTTLAPSGTPDAVGSATARCKRGTEAVSGGFDGPGFDSNYSGPVIFPLESRRDGRRKWTVSGFNDGGQPGDLIAYAYCDKSEPGLTAKSERATVDTFPATNLATARCKKKSKVVSGGFDSPDYDPSGTEEETFPFVSRRSGKRGWSAGGFNVSTSRTLDIVAYAYCEKKKAK